MSRFDLEHDILSAWMISSDLKTLANAVWDDKIAAAGVPYALAGLSELAELKFNKLFETFEKSLKDGTFQQDRIKSVEPVIHDIFPIGQEE